MTTLLAQIRVRDLVLIDDLDLEFSPGLTVLTGETGAGKSLVATAIQLLLGAKTSGEIVRRDAEEAEVEGLFDVSDEPAVRRRLREAGLPAGDELLVRRLVPARGRQRCFVNGRLASRTLLTELAGDLASFAGQHAHLALTDPAKQLDLLDAFGGLEEERALMSRLHAVAAEADGAHRQLLERERDRAQRLDYLAFQIREIDQLAPEPGELDLLDREVDRLAHLETLIAASRGSAEELYEADGSVYERLGALAREVASAARYDDSLAIRARRIEEAACLVEEVSRDLTHYWGGLDSDPGRLEELQSRREALRQLVRKHGLELSEILTHRDEIAAEIEALDRYEESLEAARKAREKAKREAVRAADALSKARREASALLAKAVSAELLGLAMKDATFSVDLTRTEDEPGPTGVDQVEFVVALNPGEGAHPLRQTASGGELSRLMLAVRRSLAGVGPLGTYVFDEVDAGIGGAEAAAVGKMLRAVAEHHQIICITHLPQIAGLADAHFLVGKSARGARTVTWIRRLSEPERVDEIARMVGGERITDKTRDAARELLAARDRDARRS